MSFSKIPELRGWKWQQLSQIDGGWRENFRKQKNSWFLCKFFLCFSEIYLISKSCKKFILKIFKKFRNFSKNQQKVNFFTKHTKTLLVKIFLESNEKRTISRYEKRTRKLSTGRVKHVLFALFCKHSWGCLTHTMCFIIVLFSLLCLHLNTSREVGCKWAQKYWNSWI